jgi:hypothetical protein
MAAHFSEAEVEFPERVKGLLDLFLFGAWDCSAWSSPWQGEFQVGAIPTRSTISDAACASKRGAPRQQLRPKLREMFVFFVRRKRLHAGRAHAWPEEVRDSTAADWEDASPRRIR